MAKNLELLGKVHIVNGLVVPKIVKQEVIDKLKDLPLRGDDVWIVTYPKAGTTWTQYIVHLIHNGGKDDGKKITDAVPWIETGVHHSSVTAEDMIPPRAFKSHMPYDRMPCGLPNSTPCKYIYVARNPKDIATSFYYQYRACHSPDIEWKEFLENFLVGKISFGNYFDHLLSWWAHRDDDNVLFIKFEDLKRDPESMVAQIATFMGYSHLSQEVIKIIAEKTDFDKMRDNEIVNYSWSSSRRDPQAPPFMRQGAVGDWKNQFSVEDSQRLDKIYQDRFSGTGLESYYREYCGQ
jgi:hypothetical protein